MPKAIVIRSGSVRVRIFASRSGKYLRHEIRWTDHHGRRRRVKRSKLADARREAQRIADDLARGHHHAELTLADLASFRAGIVNLYGTGKTIELATAEYADCRRLLLSSGAPSPSLSDLAQYWLDHHQHSPGELTVADAVRRLENDKASHGATKAWTAALRCYLKKFKSSFPGRMTDVRADAVRNWFLNLPGVNERSKNNHLAAVQDLFNLPELAHHPQRAAIQALEPIDTDEPTVRRWTPSQFRQLLHTAALHDPELVPFLVLGGLCRLRTAEFLRLEWTDIHLDAARIALSRHKAKGTKRRRRNRKIAMPDNAVVWLRACQRPDGHIWTGGQNALHRRARAICGKAGLGAWRQNALRKTGTTYAEFLAAETGGSAKEGGHSAAMQAEYYIDFEGVTFADAQAWFSVLPPAGWESRTLRLSA